MSNLVEDIKAAISDVNTQLGLFSVDGNSSQMRYENLDSEREPCVEFKDFVECKFNYMCSKIPALKELSEKTQGHLFICTGLDEEDAEKRRFKRAYFKLLTPTMVVNEYLNDELKASLEKLSETLGGNNISFNSVKKNIKLTID